MTTTWKRGALSAAAGLALGLALLPAEQAHAATLVPCNDIPALKDAITQANTTGEQIVLASGCTYTLTEIDNGENGLPRITGNVRIASNGATIRRDATATDDFRIFDVAVGGSLNLTRISITGGRLGTFSDGGAIISRGTLTLNGGTISDNKAGGGGGIATFGDGRLSLTQTNVEGNEATDNFGGGIEHLGTTMTMTRGALRNNTAADDGGGLENGGDTSFTGTVISGNTSGRFGGGIDNFGSGHTLKVASSTISTNTATRGGGIFSSGTTTLTGGTISGNTATDGAGIESPGGDLSLSQTIVQNNNASGVGGGIDVAGTLTMTQGALRNNTAADDGGGLRNGGANVTFTGTAISGNTSGGNGGGIDNVGVGTLKVASSTITNNEAVTGGGLRNAAGSTAALVNSRVTANRATGGPGSGGGILEETGEVILTGSSVTNNTPDNCAPPGSVPGCTG